MSRFSWDRERELDEHEPECGFCHGEPVVDAASWTDGRQRPPAACPRCGQVAEADEREEAA